MKKEDLSSLIVYALMLVLAALVGFLVIKPMFENTNTRMNPYLFAILIILGSLIFNVLLIEIGHAIGAKIGKYELVSFNVLGLCFYKDKTSWKFGIREFDGLTGETKIAPKDENSSPKAYVWMPLFLYAIQLIGCIIFYTLGTKDSLAPNDPFRGFALACMINVAISSMLALYNFVPVKLDSMTDGYRLTLINVPANKDAYNELLRVENLQRQGLEVESIKTFDEITDFTAQINLLVICEDLSKKDYNKALDLINKTLEKGEETLSVINTYRLMAQKIYITLMTSSLKDAQAFYEKEVDTDMRRFIANDISMESIRAYALVAGLLDKSKREYQLAVSRKEKALEATLATRAKKENTLLEEAIKKIIKNHPGWEEKENAQ